MPAQTIQFSLSQALSSFLPFSQSGRSGNRDRAIRLLVEDGTARAIRIEGMGRFLPWKHVGMGRSSSWWLKMKNMDEWIDGEKSNLRCPFVEG